MNSVKKVLAASFALALLSVPVLASAQQQQPAGGTPPAAGHAAHPRAAHTPRAHAANGTPTAHAHARAHAPRPAASDSAGAH